jgi:hypothetical protein
MVDIVTNDMGYAGCGTCVDYSIFNPFNSVRISLLSKFYPAYRLFVVLSYTQSRLTLLGIILSLVLSDRLQQRD